MSVCICVCARGTFGRGCVFLGALWLMVPKVFHFIHAHFLLRLRCLRLSVAMTRLPQLKVNRACPVLYLNSDRRIALACVWMGENSPCTTAGLKLTQPACDFFFMMREASQSIILAARESVEDEVGVLALWWWHRLFTMKVFLWHGGITGSCWSSVQHLGFIYFSFPFSCVTTSSFWFVTINLFLFIFSIKFNVCVSCTWNPGVLIQFLIIG